MAKILYVQYTNPGGYPPLQHSSRILADAGWKVLFLGTGAYGANALEFQGHPNIRVRRMRFCPAGWRQKLHYAAYCAWVLCVAIGWRPQWVYASDLLSCPVAFLLASLLGMRVVYHEHDSTDGPRARGGLAQAARGALLRKAALCVFPNEGRGSALLAGEEVPWVVVRNCPQVSEIREPVTRSQAGDILVYYHGNISSSYLPLTIIQAVAWAPGVRLRVIGYETVGAEGHIAALRAEADRLGVRNRLDIRSAMPRADLMKLCAECDVGLSLMPTCGKNFNEQYMVGASNKAFDYLACGLPLLVSDLPDWRSMFVDPGYGLSCNPEDPKSIAAAIRWLVEHPEQMRVMGENGRQRILSEWNYENQFRPVLSLIVNHQTDGATEESRVGNAV